MYLARRTRRLAGVAVVAVAAMVAVGCSSSSTPPSSSSGKAVKGGTVTAAIVGAGTTYNWIFPFYAITNASVYNGQQFQWLMYLPLYMFGANNSSSTSINYPLSTATPPVYTNGGKTVSVTMKGWKLADGSAVNAKSLLF